MQIAEWLPGLLLLLGSGFFSGAEAALFTLAAHRGGGSRQAAFVRPLFADSVGSLATILCANLIINLSYFAVAHRLGRDLALGQAALLTAASVLLLVVFGEILPKVLAHRHADTLARVLLPPVRCLHLFLAPLLRPLANRLDRPPILDTPMASGQTVTLLSGEGELGISPGEQTLLSQLLELGHLRAGALRRPLSEVLRFPRGLRLASALAEMHRQGVSSAAVVDREGIVRGVLDRARQPRGQFVADAMLPLPILPEVAPVANGVRLLIDSGRPFVLLVDEYGQDAGIIERGRWADTLLDRLPGESADGPSAVREVEDGVWEVDAALPLHDATDRFGDLGPQDVRVDTLGGLVLEHLGRMAAVGDILILEGAQRRYRIEVLRCSSTRPLLLLLRLETAAAEPAPPVVDVEDRR